MVCLPARAARPCPAFPQPMTLSPAAPPAERARQCVQPAGGRLWHPGRQGIHPGPLQVRRPGRASSTSSHLLCSACVRPGVLPAGRVEKAGSHCRRLRLHEAAVASTADPAVPESPPCSSRRATRPVVYWTTKRQQPGGWGGVLRRVHQSAPCAQQPACSWLARSQKAARLPPACMAQHPGYAAAWSACLVWQGRRQRRLATAPPPLPPPRSSWPGRQRERSSSSAASSTSTP